MEEAPARREIAHRIAASVFGYACLRRCSVCGARAPFVCRWGVVRSPSCAARASSKQPLWSRRPGACAPRRVRPSARISEEWGRRRREVADGGEGHQQELERAGGRRGGPRQEAGLRPLPQQPTNDALGGASRPCFSHLSSGRVGFILWVSKRRQEGRSGVRTWLVRTHFVVVCCSVQPCRPGYQSSCRSVKQTRDGIQS